MQYNIASFRIQDNDEKKNQLYSAEIINQNMNTEHIVHKTKLPLNQGII